jgi:ATP-dependent Clp protease ATP-binding subunit ClpA
MKEDLSKSKKTKKSPYPGVLNQQGNVELDSDENVGPNLEFIDVWIRFISSVADSEIREIELEKPNISSEQVRKKVTDKILDFFNKVETAEEIDKAVEIPDERDVGVRLGERILEERNRLGKFTSLKQIDDIPYIGPERFAEIVMTLGGIKMKGKHILEEDAQKIAPIDSWENIELSEEIKSQLKEFCDDIAEQVGITKNGEVGKFHPKEGIIALFTGSSGTGKTLGAKIIANLINLDLYRVDLAALVNKYIGETEKNLHKIFNEAERSNVILLFDEADSLFGKRSEVKDSHDRYSNIEINYLLQKMEEYKGLCILATNMREALDDAFLRRIKIAIEFRKSPPIKVDTD